ncbi:MAG TPA: MarR family transcriptional regulator [Acidimicrobiales bacterium]|jgi:DNA-binding MarR family transcriptional regulator|nr:MarR family transcriptional regulator [Acidimicrobiales bacterium]
MPDDDVEQLRKQLNRLFRRVRSEQPDVEGIPPTAFEVLITIERAKSALRPGQLGAELHMTSPNVASTLRNLESMGLVARRQDLHDGRKSYVDLTQEGKKIIAEVRSQRPAWLREAMENTLNEKEKRLLLQAGSLMQRLADYGSSRRSY